MASREVLLSHGRPLDPEEKRIECVHCGKVVPGFNRLQQHIGGVGKDVLECLKAPADIKEMFKARLVECKIKKLFREVGDLQQPLVLPKRNSSKAKDKGIMPAPHKGGSIERGRKRSSSGSLVIREMPNPSELAGPEARSKSMQSSGTPSSDLESAEGLTVGTLTAVNGSQFISKSAVSSGRPSSSEEDPCLGSLTAVPGSEGRPSYKEKEPKFHTLTALAGAEARSTSTQLLGTSSMEDEPILGGSTALASSKARSKSGEFSGRPSSGGEEASLDALTTSARSEARSKSRQCSERPSRRGGSPTVDTLTTSNSSQTRNRSRKSSGSAPSKRVSGTSADYKGRSKLPGQPSCSRPAPFLRNLRPRGGHADQIESSNDARTNFAGLSMNSFIIERKRCIGRFFLENGIDFSALKSSSFLSVLEFVIAGGAELTNCVIPNVHELKGWILRNELQEIRKHIDEIKRSWTITGCCMLLDVWCDDANRTLMNVLVSCPKGTIYLRSVDVTIASQDTEAMEIVLNGLVQEVGINNVIQVIADTALENINAAGKRLMGSHNSLFYTVSAAHCFEIILEDVCRMDLVQKVMNAAKYITKFIYTNPFVFELMSRSVPQHHVVSLHTFKVVRPFFTLLNLSVNAQSIKDMFASPEWKNSRLAQTVPGLLVSFIVVHGSIWENMDVVLRGAIPIIQALHRVKRDDEETHMGCIFELVGKLKKGIKKNLGNDERLYGPFCSIVDRIWCSVFQKAIHCVAYFLNPKNQYSNKFQDDVVVRMGFRNSLRHMIPDESKLQEVLTELGLYNYRTSAFRDGYGAQDLHGVSPGLKSITYSVFSLRLSSLSLL